MDRINRIHRMNRIIRIIRVNSFLCLFLAIL